MTTQEKEVVAAVRARLAQRIGETRFELWFGAHTQLALDGETLRVIAPTDVYRELLRKNFCQLLEICCREITGRTPAVEFSAGPARGDAEAPATNGAPRPAKDRTTAKEPAVPARVDPLAVVQVPSQPHDAGQPAPPPRGRKFNSLHTLVEGTCNQLALHSARLVVRQLGKLSPLFVHGPTAVGKTHLLEGIYKEARQHRQLQAVYLSAEQFTNYFVDAVRGSGLPNFRRKYRGLDLLILDDVQFFCGKKGTLAELLHTIDTVLHAGRQVVCASDRSPSELPGLSMELQTRLVSGVVCPMDPPDHVVRLGIVRQLAGELELDAPPDVVEFVAANLTSHARELAGAMKLLKATCLTRRVGLNLALAEAALAEMIRHGTPVVRLGDIEHAVCSVFGLEPKSLQTGGKQRAVNHPRMLAMWLARKYTRVALTQIGQYFGRRSHSTVISAQRKVDGWVAKGQSLCLADQRCTAEEAIRRVEQRLRVG